MYDTKLVQEAEMITIIPKSINSEDSIIFGDTELKADINDRQLNKKIFYLIQSLMGINQLNLNMEYGLDWPSSDYDDSEVYDMTKKLIWEYNWSLKVLEIREQLIPSITVDTKLDFMEVDNNNNSFIELMSIYRKYTFGRIIPLSKTFNMYGFLYLITLSRSGKNITYRYVGQKSFGRGSEWETYQGSSDIVAELIEKGFNAKYEVYGYYATEKELLEAEKDFIQFEWANNRGSNLNFAYDNGRYIVKRDKYGHCIDSDKYAKQIKYQDDRYYGRRRWKKGRKW